MNNVLTLNGKRFMQRNRTANRMSMSVPRDAKVNYSKLVNIHNSLLKVQNFWNDNNLIDGVLISAYYNRIVAKSNRINGYLKIDSKNTSNDSIVGAKFNKDKNQHIITHYVAKNTLENTIKNSENVLKVFKLFFSDVVINKELFDTTATFDSIPYEKYDISKTTFKQYIRDACFVDNFGIEKIDIKNIQNSIITFYDIGVDVSKLLSKIGINITTESILNSTTVLLDDRNVNLLLGRAPYLISMAVEDFSKLSHDDFEKSIEDINTAIPSPTNEPIVGVIDTLFEQNVYFGEWVDYHDMISENIPKESSDYEHGTAVTSLIVDGPNLNKNLDDGCGRFRVRHFGVSLHSGFNSFSIIKQIQEIVSQNTDIKVWNLSLGSSDEVRSNFISAEAAVLDDIQFEYDVIFVIAGTNFKMVNNHRKKIGAPADSLNSIIVNSVDFNNNPVDFSRKGIVLSFFIKPDVSYYGGGNGDFINVCKPLGAEQVAGTSFAAPFISRKLAYLIYIMGLSKEAAKALIIDSAIGWNDKKSFEEQTLLGNGIVPIKINDILSTKDDEIKFIVTDISEKYDSYNYDFPVPIFKNEFPYVAKATMCYFPKCSRNQGVDYTNTELNLTFGRLKEDGIEPINKDKQNDDDAPGYIRENSARAIYRKWDNVKHIAETFTPRKRSKPIVNKSNPQWGMSVKTIERLKKRDGQGVRFGVVVTLKELNGVNRIDDFINQAQLRGWLVNQIQIDTQIKLYNSLSEDITFD